MRTIMRDFCNFRYVTKVLKAVLVPRCHCTLAVCGLLLAGLPVAQAQDLEFGFAAGMGSENTEFSHGVAVDSTGNVYMGGYFRGRADFDPGTGTAFLTSAGDADAYLQKLDSSGNLVWVKTFSGPENIFGYAVMVDNQGNAYLAGSFSGTADFDPGAGVTQFTASGSDAFIVKLSSSGALVWARKMGSADTEVALGLAVDSSRNVYATGYFGTTADFDPGAGVVNLVSAGAHDVFVQKLDSSGNFVWARGMGGTADDMGHGVAVDDSGNVYTAGSFEGSGDFNPGAGTTTLTSRGGSDIFVQKLSSAGVLSWAVGMGGSGDDAGSGIGVDKEGNPYTTGYFRGTVDFNPGIASSNAVSNGAQDAFVQRLSTDGLFAWAVTMGGSSTDVGTAIEVNDNGDVHVTGSFTGSVDFEPGTGTTTLASAGVTDVFAQRLDQNGGFVWAKSIGGSAGDEGMAIALDASLGVYLAGTFKASVDFDPSAGTFTIGSNGEADVFVEKLNSSGGFVWAGGVGGVSSEAGRSVAVDATGNVYTTGLFAGVVDFDPGASEFDVTSAGREDAFVQKLDSNGELAWALALGGVENDGGLGIAVDATGNVYLTGYFSGTMDLNPGVGVSTATAAGSSDVFVVKLNASGGFVWGYTLGDTGADLGTSIAVDSTGAVLVTGTYNGTVDLDPGAATQNVTSKGLSDLFVQKLSSGKSLLWADGLGGVAIELATHIGVDASDNVYLAGSFQGGVDFEPGSGTTTLTSGGATDAYIVKLDENGAMVWARNVGSNLNEVAYGADVDGSGNVYVVGSFQGTPDFDPGAGVVNATSAGGSDIYLQKFDASGAFLWVRTMGGTATDTGYDVAVDAAGNPYTIGAFQSTASFNGGAEQRTSLGVSDIFLQSMDSSGGFNWVNAYGNGGVDEGRGIATSPADSVVTTGIFSITVDFDPGAGVVSLASAGNSTDIFVYQLEQDLVPTVASIVPATTGPTNADTIGFTVTFSEPVLEFNALADLVLVHSGTAHTGASVSGGPVVYSVSVTGVSGNGSFTLAVSTATGIVDSSGNLLDSSITSSAVSIDNTAPTLSIGSPSASLTNDGPVTFPVTYSGANSVNLTAGAITLNATGTATGTISVSNGTTSTPTVSIGSITGNGTLGIGIGSGTASDTAGNSASGAGPSATFTVDNTAPTLSIASPSVSLTRGGPVTYAVTYSGANSVNLTAGAITLSPTGTATGTVSVTNGTTSTPTVRISSITGNGTLRISIGAGTASDTAGNSAPGAGPSTTFTVDNTAPTLSIASPSVSLTKGGPVTYAVTYSGASTVNLTSGAITLNSTGTATGTVSVTNGTTSTPTVVISSITGNGTLGFSIGTGTASDAAGNTAAGAGPSATFTVDNTAPTLSVGTPSVSLTKGGPVTYAVTYSGASSINLTSGAISLNTTGTATGTVSVSNGTTSTPTVTISGITGNGSVGISIGGGTASDAAGNTASAAGPSATFTVDNTAPTVAIGAPSVSITQGGPVTYAVTFGGASSANLTSGAITLNTTGTATGTVSVTNGTTGTPTVTISSITGNGTLGISIGTGTASDAAGNSAAGAGPSATFTVDNTAPTLAIASPSVSATRGGPVSYSVTYNGADTVNLSEGAITLNTTGAATGSVSVTGGTTSTPTVTVSGITGDGTLGITISSGTASDTAGNSAAGAGPSAVVTVDNTAPTLSIGAPDAALTTSGPVSFPVTYGGADSFNLTPNAITLNSTGTATGTVSVTNGSTSTPTVTIGSISGDGTLGISIAGDTASDSAGNNAPGAGPSVTFTADNTAPTLSIGAPDASQTTGGPVSFLVTYAGADSVNLTPGAISLNATGTATGMVSVTDGSSSTPTVIISNITGDGVLGISIESGTATDTAGNDAPGAGPSATFAVDNNEPTLAIGAPDVSLTAVGPVSYIVTYDGADSINLTPDAITLNTTGTATGSVSVTDGTTSTPSVTISEITGDGTVGISIDSGTAQDSVGNLVPAAGPATTFTVDNTAPVVAIAAPSASLTATGPVNYPVTVSGADTVNLTVGAIALNATGTASASVSIVDGTTSTPTVTLDNVTGDGSLAISIAGAIATDLAGNGSVSVGPGEAVVVDNTPPVLIIGAPTSALTSGGPVSFPLTYSGADTVELLPESVSLHVTGSASGTVTVLDATSATPTVTIDAITGDGTLGISVAAGTALDGAGNLSDAAGPSDTFAVDNTDPTGTVNALVTKDGTPALSGTVDDSEATIFVSVGGETLFPAVNNGDSTWSLPDNTIEPALADGLYSVSLALEDPAGNAVTIVASNVLNIDTLAPLVSVDALATSDTTPVLSGAVSDLNEVAVEVSAGGQTLPAAVSNGTWSVQIAEPLADGTYDVIATATDAAGNVAADTSTDELFVSTASTLLGFEPVTTSDTTPQLQGTAEDALGVNAVEVTVGGDSYTATLGDGTWTVEIAVPLAEGTYDVVLNALNSASTPSTATYSGALTIDATAPVATVDTNIVNSATPGLSGTVEDSSEIVSISLTVDGVVYAPLVTGNAWVLEATDPLPDGIYDVVVSAVDAAGNAGADITSDELTVDTQAPGPVELILNDASPTRETLIGFTLTFDEAVTGVDRGDFLLVVDGVPQEPFIPDTKVIGATPLSVDVAGEGMQYVLSVSTGTGDGSIAVLLENDGTILDHAGNALVAGLDPSEAYTLDRTPPQAAISTTESSPTSQTAIPIVITFEESVTGFLLEDLSVENGAVADLQGDGLNYAATLVPASAGEVLVALIPGSVTDGVGNPVGEVQELSIQFSPGGEGEGEGEGETCVEQCAGEGVDGDGDGLSTCVEDCIGTSDATTDSDNDGIADSFELRYGLDPLSDDAADDADFDDLSNLAEFLVNSDPTDANSPDSTLFVATDGSDETGNGTESAPWRTISFALDQSALLGGDSIRIVVQTGTYVEDLLLEEGVSITGATGSDVVIQGMISGAQGSSLRSLTIIPAEGASHMLEMNDVAMLLLEVDFIGTPARDVTAILVDGNAVPLDSVIDACSFSSVGVGIDIGGEIPAIRRCTFGNIPAQFGDPATPGAGIIIRANSALNATTGTIGDQSDPENGWNDFLNTIEGFAVINEREDSLIMQTNYWGVGEEGEVSDRISGPAVFVPILSQSSAILAASLFCTVWDDTDQARIKSAGVKLTISPLNEVTNNIDGIYAFPAISENEYTLTIRAPGYAEKSSVVEVRAGELLSLTIPMSAAAAEGEGEGEGETGCNASKYLVAGTASDSAASIFLFGLTVSILLGWSRIGRRE